MFRRLESGLPKDPVFPTSLAGLGYFVNDKDEIRSIENPKAYFKFFLTRNDRHNCVQREAMNGAIRELVAQCLEDLGLEKVRLPLGTEESEPHVPIFVSSNIRDKKRVVILFYEHTQDLGIFAHRIIGGKGGIEQGSAISFVKYIQSKITAPGNVEAPGIILANMGQLRWWRKGKKAVTQTTWYALPQKSSVENPIRFDAIKNTVPGNRNTEEHVNYIFNHVVEKLVDPIAKLDVVGVSDGAIQVTVFLEKHENFKKWENRVAAFASVATWYHSHEIKNVDFADWFMDRGRVYILSSEPAGTFLADHKGAKYVPAYGCPVFSLGEPYYAESMLPKGYRTIIDWFQEVNLDPDYANPTFQRIDFEEEDEEEKPMEGGVELNRIEEVVDDETEVADETLKVEEPNAEEIKIEKAKVEVTKMDAGTGKENKKPGEEVS
ncbi:hypothetical protein L207DRAFT_640108 [Hyaloscypha variabilis F]|uniref:Arb2 domain-containing protein n=1 Tax=Hyaloscypha variabilis (strain UAMH 11265 / GT02V1 / F) TaxID=1149755 RepID=A0A2J6R197_HYAVF|nr:hypothetical protein L207DRAFT_640108 [Hyaloscypha variabilis F]